MLRRALALAALGAVPSAALAAGSPFGVGIADGPSPIVNAGPLTPLFIWVATQQAAFSQALIAAMGESGLQASLALFALAFAYGVFHAAGPGHGKAVISSYLFATGETLRRGILLSFASAFVQASVAVILVGIASGIVGATAKAMTRAEYWLEVGSYALIVLVGAWLLWRKVFGDGHDHAAHGHDDHGHHGHGHDAHHHHGHHSHDHEHGHAHDHAPAHARVAHDHDHPPVAVAQGGAAVAALHDHGHSHIPQPATLTGRMTFGRAAQAVLAVGIRPCSGAIILLVFAWAEGLFPLGVVATYVMALGTGLTVAVLAVLAVGARGLAKRLAGAESGRAAKVIHALEIAAAAAVLILGLLLLGGALAGQAYG